MDTDSGDQNGAKKSNVLPFWDDSSSDVPDVSTCRDGSVDQTTLTELRPVTPFQIQSASSYEASPALSTATISSIVSKICIPTPMPSPPPYHTKCYSDFCPIHSDQSIESDTSYDELIIFPSSRLKKRHLPVKHSRQSYLNSIGRKYWMKLQAIEEYSSEEDHDPSNSVTQQNAHIVESCSSQFNTESTVMALRALSDQSQSLHGRDRSVSNTLIPLQSQVQAIEERSSEGPNPSNSVKQQDAPISPIAQCCPTRSNTESTVMASPAPSAQSQSFYGTDSSVSELAIPRQSKKRSKCRDNWADTRRKRQKNLGQEYSTKTGKVFNAKQMGPPCSCKFKCFDRISYEQRLDIFKKFWELGDRKKQWEYVLKYTTKEKKKRCLYQATTNKRTFTYKYYLPLSLDKSKEQASSINVCKKMFLNTISLSDRIIKTAWDKYDNSTIVEDDYRGRHKNHRKVIIEDMITSVCDHVNSFVPIESHYLRKKTTKLYLDGSLNIARMFKLYMEWFDTDKYTSKAETERQYREIVKKKFNLCFFIPKKDQCDVCHAHRNLQNPSTEQIEEYQKHQTAKTVARSLKGEDKKEAMSSDGKVLCAVFDFEKVLTCPHGQVSIFYYKRKLSCLNFTVYDMASKQATCYMWDETVAKRGANEVSSCLFDYIDINWKNGVQEFRFWSDNCAGQNRNRINFFFYMYAAKKYKINIKHSFLEKGHTQNEGDSVHSVIENASANKTIYTPEEWSLLVRWSKSNGPPYEVKNMSQNDFYDFKSHIKNSAWNKNSRGQKIEWTRIKEVFVHKEDPHQLKYRYNLTEEYETLTIKPTTRRSQGLPVIAKAYDAPIPLNIDKYKDIVSLCNSGIIPRQYKDYFMSLPHLGNDNTRDNCDITDSDCEHSD